MRTPMVTRTIVTTNVNVLCVDVTKQETFNQTITLPRTYKDNKALLKAVSAVIENEEIKPVAIKSIETQETLYGMSEQDFINAAQILPPRGTKAE